MKIKNIKIYKDLDLIQKKIEQIQKKCFNFEENYQKVKLVLWSFVQRGFLKPSKSLEEDQLIMNLESLFLQDYDAYVQFINKYYKVMKVPADFEIKEPSAKKTAFQTKALRLQRIEALFEENPKIELTVDYISSIIGFSKMQTRYDRKTLLEQKQLVPYRDYKKQLQKILILQKVQF